MLQVKDFKIATKLHDGFSPEPGTRRPAYKPSCSPTKIFEVCGWPGPQFFRWWWFKYGRWFKFWIKSTYKKIKKFLIKIWNGKNFSASLIYRKGKKNDPFLIIKKSLILFIMKNSSKKSAENSPIISQNAKEKIYRFYLSPEFLKLSDADQKKEGKKMRSKLRNKRRSLMNRIYLAFKKNYDLNPSKISLFIRKSENQEMIEEILGYYRENHSLNDFSLKSFYQGGNAGEIEECEMILSIMKKFYESSAKSAKKGEKKS